MRKPITITLEERLEKKLRSRQSTQIKTDNKSVSFSDVVNNVIEEGLKNA